MLQIPSDLSHYGGGEVNLSRCSLGSACLFPPFSGKFRWVAKAFEQDVHIFKRAYFPLNSYFDLKKAKFWHNLSF